MDFAVKLADEGVPLRAIARAIGAPSEIVRDQLHKARNEGRLVTLPCEDWPSGFPRDQRALQLSRMVNENKDAVNRTVRELFGLTGTEARMLLALVQAPMVSKMRGDMSVNNVMVHIHSLRRKLKPHGLRIETLRDYGYQLASPSRRAVVDLILSRVVQTPPGG